jgi:hypothetical protein
MCYEKVRIAEERNLRSKRAVKVEGRTASK